MTSIAKRFINYYLIYKLMKYTIAVCALLGLMTKEQVNAHKHLKAVDFAEEYKDLFLQEEAEMPAEEDDEQMQMFLQESEELNLDEDVSDEDLLEYEDDEMVEYDDDDEEMVEIEENESAASESESESDKESQSSDDSSSSSDSDVQLGDDTESDDEDVQLGDVDDYGEIGAYMHNSEAHGGYTRDVPHRFTAERDDRLMNSMIQTYAREITKDGEKTGHMFLNHDDAWAASQEVIATHTQHNAVQAGKAEFENVWNHFDVNHDNLVEVERMPQFFRMLLGNSLDIDLQ